jgi:CHASE1-domain containing sensor protein
MADETKRQKFVRLANKRTNAAVAKIDLLGNLASGQYESTTADVEQIETALYNAVDAAMKRFGKMTSDKPEFALAD